MDPESDPDLDSTSAESLAKVDELDRLEAQADSDEEDQFLMPVGLVRGRSVGLGWERDPILERAAVCRGGAERRADKAPPS